MTWYTIAVVLHVVVAVLGVGQVGAVAIAASAARRSGMELPQAATWLAPLLRCTRWSLVLMLASGMMCGTVALITILMEAKPF